MFSKNRRGNLDIISIGLELMGQLIGGSFKISPILKIFDLTTQELRTRKPAKDLALSHKGKAFKFKNLAIKGSRGNIIANSQIVILYELELLYL